MQRTMPFVASGWIHGFVLAAIALAPNNSARSRSAYEQEIEPHEKRIIWYNVHDRLPDISPTSTHKSNDPARAREKFDQTIVAGNKDLPGPKQLIAMAAPEIKTPDLLPLPNVVGMSPPRPLRDFTAPVPKPPEPLPVPHLPDAPRVTQTVDTSKLPIESRIPKPAPRPFKPPPTPKPKAPASTQLPDAPAVSAVVEGKDLPIQVPDRRAPLRTFTPPPERKPKLAVPAALPDAPDVALAAEKKDLPFAIPEKRAPRRAFNAPPAAKPKVQAPEALPDAPTVTAAVQGKDLPINVADPKAPPRAFTPPQTPRRKAAPSPDLPAAPEVAGTPSESGTAEVSLAIVGIHPAKVPDFPTPPGSRPAGFSAGPDPKRDGSEKAGATSNSMLSVPGLLVRGGPQDAPANLLANASPTSHDNLLAAARAALNNPAAGASPPPIAPHESRATRVTSAPDPRLDGRAIYTVAIQMPNVTSFSGSWMVWFADHEPEPGAEAHEIRAPVPLRKVDPKYIAAAAAENVEGVVRLFAVIRKDGHVEAVGLVRHLDERLDKSAQEALAQWIFQPATLDGKPIAVDAVFEIPFHLAPKPAK
ncbi:MAG TPA: TonB family protein [Bryobacteraceae bacterium]|nr:TonB family protein [Bryobacteraceae bacterium]